MNLSDIDIEPLVSRKNVPDWSNLQSVFASEDATLSQRMALAKGRGNTLRYVQRIQVNRLLVYTNVHFLYAYVCYV